MTERYKHNFFYRSSKASIKTEDLAKAIVFNATKKTITEGKTETIEHADILDISKEATEIPKVSLNFIHYVEKADGSLILQE